MISIIFKSLYFIDYYFSVDCDGMDCPEVWARIAVLNGQTQAAETLYLEQNQVEKAIQMYLSLYKWENGNNVYLGLFKL